MNTGDERNTLHKNLNILTLGKKSENDGSRKAFFFFNELFAHK